MGSNRRLRPRGAPTLSTAIAAAGSLVVVVTTAVVPASILASLLGCIGVTGGLHRGHARAFAAGVAAQFGAVLIAGLAGVAPTYLTVAAVALVVAWVVGRGGQDLVAEVGHEPATLRIEGLRVASAAVVVTAGAAVGIAVFLAVAGRQSLGALLGLLVGSVALLLALGR